MMEKYILPTGYLFVDDYKNGKLETLSIGDYGKEYNVKADFLGYTRPINGVPNTYCMPLSEKWVVTLSTQYGCPMKCNFCDVPNVRFAGNVSYDDLVKQFISAVKLFDVKYTERLNVHFARMGDPIFNKDVFEFAEKFLIDKREVFNRTGLRIEVVHPVLTTSSPKNFKHYSDRIRWWGHIKNNVYNGQAGLQFSINSTDAAQREKMFGDMALSIEDIAEVANKQLEMPVGRKYCLNFAYSTDFIVNPNIIKDLFDPEKFMIKITPIHNNNACRDNNIKTEGGYTSYEPYLEIENSFKECGFDVLVFVPSIDEEDGLVTCGNAITGGGRLNVDTSIIKIKGI